MNPASHTVVVDHASHVRLCFDTGQSYPIGKQIIVGRDRPESASIRHVCPSGDVASLSRTHAVIDADAGHVTLSDAGSLNGTFVWDRYSRNWERIVPGRPIVLGVGAMIALGWRTARIEYAPVRSSTGGLRAGS